MHFGSLTSLILLSSLAVFAGGQRNPAFNSLQLSESGFVQRRSQLCLHPLFTSLEPPTGPFLQLGFVEACARLCWYRADCQGFSLNQAHQLGTVCEFFIFNRCTEDLSFTRACDRLETMWLRWKPQSKGFCRHSPLCPISFSGHRHGDSRFRLVSVAAHREGWLGGLHECHKQGSLAKFADVDNVAEGIYMRSLLNELHVEAAYVGGYFGHLNGELLWRWQPCKEPISESVLNSKLLSLQHNITVIAQEGWEGGRVDFAICECIDPFDDDDV